MNNGQNSPIINIDWAPVCDFGKYFLDKMEKLGCFVLAPKGTMPEAIDTYINHIKELKLNNPVTEAVLIARARKDIRYYSNNADVVAMAFNQMHFKSQQVSSDIDEIEDDWFSYFFDRTQHVSDDGMKAIWASILAGNLTKPNSIPKHLLHILSVMDKSHAESFTEIIKYIICVENGYHVVCDFHNDNAFWTSKNINLDKFISLESIGLINYSSIGFGVKCDNPVNELVFNICGYPCKINHSTDTNELVTGNILLTDSGLALFKCLENPKDNDAKEHVFAFIEKNGYKVTQI